MTELNPVIVALREAVSAAANDFHADEDGPVMVTEAVVIYEIAQYQEDGSVGRAISYTIPTDNFSLSGALGLLEAGKHYIRRDILCRHGDDDDG